MKKILLFGAAALIAASASAATEWVSIIQGGNAADGETPSIQAGWNGPAKVVANPAGEGVVFETPIAADPVNAWDSQMFIVFDEPLLAGDVYKVSFDYYCSDSRAISVQAHGEMGAYQHWTCGIPELPAKAEWQSVNIEEVITADMAGSAGFKTIAFNLSSAPEAATFYVNKVKVCVEKESGEGGGDEPAGKTMDMLPSLSNEAYDAATKTITFGKAWDWINWWFGEGDFSEYDDFVLEFEPVSYTVQVMVQYNEGDDQAVQAQAGENKIVVPLDAARKNSIKQMAIQNSEIGTLTLNAAYFAASAGVHTPTVKSVLNGVYNLNGVKVADELNSNLPKGIYIVNGKKVVR